MGKFKAMLLENGGAFETQGYVDHRICQKCYVGIDPGKAGGLCVLRSDGVPLEYTIMPNGKSRIIDWINHVNLTYSNLVIIAELAQAMPKQGVVSCFRYGQHFAIFEDVAILLRIPYIEVRPAIWKKAFGLTSKKTDSISACRRLFPLVNLVPPACRTEHDGIAEALLVAEWGRRKNL